MNIRHFTIRSILFIQAVCLYHLGLAQKTTQQLPDISYDWEELYKNDDDETKDSAIKWVKQLKALTSTTTSTVVEECGKYFFRLSDLQIQNQLLDAILSDSKVTTNYESWKSKIESHVNNLKATESINVYDQIWHEDIYLNINDFNYSRDVKDTRSTYVELINQIDTGCENWNEFSTAKYNKIYRTISKEKNDFNRIYSLFLLADKLLRIRCSTLSVSLVINIIDQCEKSNSLTNVEKASFLIGCVKIAIPIEQNYKRSTRIYSLLLEAQGYLKLENEQHHLLKNAKIITACYLTYLGDNYSIEKAIQDYTNDTLIFKQETNPKDIYQQYAYTSIAFAEFFNLERNYYNITDDKKKIQVLLHFISALKQYKKVPSTEKSSINNLHSNLLSAIADYLMATGDKKSLQHINFARLNHEINSKHKKYSGNFTQILYSIALNYHMLGDSISRENWDRVIKDEHLLDFDEEVRRLFHNQSLVNVYSELINSLEKENVSLNEIIEAVETSSRYTPEIATRVFNTLKGVYKQQAYKKALVNDWKNAYLFKAKSDSIESDQFNFYATMLIRGEFGAYQPEKLNLLNSLVTIRNQVTELEIRSRILNTQLDSSSQLLAEKEALINIRTNELLDREAKLNRLDTLLKMKEYQLSEVDKILNKRNAILILTIIISLIIALVATFAIYQKKKASRLALYNEFRSNVWQELGHFPGSSIDDSYLKLRQIGVSDEHLTTLEELKSIISNLFVSIASGESEKGNPITEEIELARQYVDYKNRVHGKAIKLKFNGSPNTNVPPALMLSCVRNAIQHGKLLNISNAEISIETSQSKKCTLLYIKNNGTQFPEQLLSPKNISQKSTGFRNMENVLNYFNRKRRIPQPVKWENITDETYTVQTILKVKV